MLQIVRIDAQRVEAQMNVAMAANPIIAERCEDEIAELMVNPALSRYLCLPVFDFFLSVLIAIPVTIIIWLGWRIQLLDHASLHIHNHTITHSLSLVLVVVMKSKELKT